MLLVHSGNQPQLRENNLTAVLDQLHSQAPLSRAELATLTGLNKSTISSLVDELIARGLIIETGMKTSRTGRPGTMLELNPKAGCSLGLEIGVDFLLIVICDFMGNILWRRYEAVEPDTSQEVILNKTFVLVEEALKISHDFSDNILGLGVTIPGMVDIQQGTLIFSPNHGWRNVPLWQIFSDLSGLPVYVDNDATAAALGEHLFGNARQTRDFLFVLVGIGIGCGMFLDGKLYRGSGGYAGEIGHTILGIDVNRPCRCGHRGCWETYGNQYSLIERMRARLEIGQRSLVSSIMAETHVPLSLRVIVQAADAGDLVALDVLTETGRAIGLGIANLIDTLNPAMIVLGGTLCAAGRYLLPSVKVVVEERSLPEPFHQSQLVLSRFGTDAVVMGAVGMVIKAILINPLKAEANIKQHDVFVT